MARPCFFIFQVRIRHCNVPEFLERIPVPVPSLKFRNYALLRSITEKRSGVPVLVPFLVKKSLKIVIFKEEKRLKQTNTKKV